MEWDAIGAIGEVVGALAVIATLIYLSTQIRQNTNNLNVTASISLVENTNRTNADISANPQAQTAYLLALNDPDRCDQIQLETAYHIFRMITNNVYLAWSLRTLDSAKQELWEAALATHMEVFKTRGGRRWFLKFGRAYGEEFFEVVTTAMGSDEIVADFSF